MTLSKAKTEYPTINFIQVALFNLLILVWWLEAGLRVSLLGSIRFEFLLAATVSIIAYFRYASRPRQPKIRKSETNSDIYACIITFLIILLFSLPLAISFDVAWNAFVNRVAKLALIGVLISQFVVSPTTLRVYLFTLLLAFLKIGQEGFLGKITGNMVWENQGVPRLHGTQGTMFGDPNSLSGKTVSTIPFIWYLFPTIRTRWIKLMVILLLVFAINIILFTASRTGYVTFISIILMILMLSKKKKLRMIFFVLIGSAIAINFIPDAYKDRFLSTFTGQEAEGQSSATRKALLFDSFKAFTDNPLGVGIGCFPYYQAQNGRNAQETHNLYTQLLAETGIQGFVCFLALLVAILRKTWNARRAFMKIMERLEAQLNGVPPDQRNSLDRELQDAHLLYGTATALIVFTFVRLALGLFGHDFLEIYWWFAAGLAMALHNMRRTAEARCAELTGPYLRRPGKAKL